MNLSASAVMASHLSKTQVNNYMNYSPTKTHYSSSSELARDLSSRPSPQYTSGAQRYSPELEGLRRELNDQMRNYFYSLSSDITVLKKDSSDNKGQFEDLRREIDSMNSKLAQLKISNTSEIQQLRESSKKNNWVRSERKTDDSFANLGEVNEKIYQISRQIHTLNGEMETLKKPNYVSKEQFSRTMGDVIDELERKLQIINERVRERIEEMDISLVRSQNEKEKDVNRLYTDMKNMQTSISEFNRQVNNIARDSEANVEDQVKKMMNSFSGDFRNTSTTINSAEHKHKGYKKDEHSILSSSAYPHQNKEVEVKLRELDSISQTIGLLEKEMRAKIDMVDLNINSIKRNLELELSIQLKHMVLPIQKNLEQYLQSTESRFSALEDAVLNHMKRDSYIMTAERASRLRGSGSLDLRGSNFEEHMQFSTKPPFNNISVIDPHVESRQDNKKGSQPESRGGSGLKDRGREKDRLTTDAFRIDEVDSVMSMNETLQSTLKGEGRYGHEQKSSYNPPYQRNENQDTLEAEEEEEEEEEAPSTNTAKEILNDKDRNKKQKKAEEFFKDLETKQLPETMFRDFPSTSAMKSALEMEHPDNKQDRAGSAKKKKPEIDVGNTHKSSLRDAPKKQGAQSPFNKLALTTNAAYMDDEEEEEQAPPLRKNDPVSKGREAPEIDDADEFQGNIKGLLRKSRNKKENQFQEEEEKPASKQKGKFEQEAPKYGKEPVQDAFKKHPPLPKKDFEKNAPVQKQLPPVDTKSMKDFNKGGNKNLGGVKGPQGKAGNMAPNMGYQRGFDSGDAWGMQQGDEDEGESVEEIVYNVDEEGFLVDEQGNYLVDEQGNFLQLSPEQMREIEERDIVYEKEY